MLSYRCNFTSKAFESEFINKKCSGDTLSRIIIFFPVSFTLIYVQVTWLASWTENIQSQIKYVMLNPSSRLKGEKDMEKYERARMLKTKIGKIRDDYNAGKL